MLFPHLFRLAETSRKSNGVNRLVRRRVDGYTSAIFPPGGTSAEKAFRPLDRSSAIFPPGGTLAEPAYEVTGFVNEIARDFTPIYSSQLGPGDRCRQRSATRKDGGTPALLVQPP